MAKFEDWYNDVANTLPPIERVAKVHADFLAFIHLLVVMAVLHDF